MTRRDPIILRILLTALLVTVLGVLTGCERSTPEAGTGETNDDSYFQVEPQTVEAVHRNNLRHEPTDFLRSRAEDPIHWQGWSSEIFAHAEKEQRLVFAVIGSAEFPQTVTLLDLLRKRRDLVDEFNSSYVNTLVDVNAHPELALLLTDLCAEIQRPVSFPLLAWFSHEGNPVAWLPLTMRDVESFDEVFGSSGTMVQRIWRDSPRYVIVNSARDNAARLERMSVDQRDPLDAEALRESVQTGARNLAALFDPASGEVDGGGGLVPAGLLQFTSQAYLSPDIPDGTADTLRTLTSSLSGTLLSSAVHDPLDGGFFAGRRSRAWEIPNALKTANTQSLMSIALARAGRSLDQGALVDGARGCLGYNATALTDGPPTVSDYVVVIDQDVADRAFFWSQEKVRELLSKEEYEVARRVFELSGLGNIPLESDPRRDYFRKNTLALSRSAEEVAGELGLPVTEASALLESACRRLQTYRQELLTRSEEVFTERSRITSTNANYLGALAHLARITGDRSYHEQALAVRGALRDQHRAGDGSLLRFAASEGRRAIPARGEDYAALLDALFSLYRNDLDPAHLADILALTDEVLERLQDEHGYLREAPAGDRILELPTYSGRMIFGPSTWGRIYGPLERLRQLANTPALDALAGTIRSQIGSRTGEQPMIYTDFLQSALVPLADTVVILSGTPGETGFDALHEVLLRPEFEAVTVVHSSAGLPERIRIPAELAPGATVSRGGETAGTATSPVELERLLSADVN